MPEAGAENTLATPKRSSVPQSEALASASRAWRGKGAGLLLTAGPDAAARLLEGTVVVSLWHRVGAAHRSTGRVWRARVHCLFFGRPDCGGRTVQVISDDAILNKRLKLRRRC